MKHSNLIVLFLAAALALGCPLSGNITPQPGRIQANPTTVPLSTTAPLEIATEPPAGPATYPPLMTNGPFLVYLRGLGKDQQIVVLDADGKGRKPFPSPLPDSGGIPSIVPIANMVSPDGKWLAYYTGSAGQYGQAGGGTADLALNLMSLSDGSTRLVTRLLSPDYPDNFAKAAAELNQADADAQSLQDAFVAGITQSIAWSPDGRYLAFAGQMDGTSSDLYVYDSTTGGINRLSSGPEEVQWIDWSPDGKWIVDGSTLFVGMGMSYNEYATTVDGSVIKSLASSTTGLVEWLNDQTFVEYDSENGPGDYNLRAVDVQTGSIKVLWKGSFHSYAIDRMNGLLAVSGITDPNQWTGSLYLITLASGKQIKVKDGVWFVSSFVMDGQSFFVQSAEGSGEQYFLTADGSLTPSVAAPGNYSIAPDGGHWISIEKDRLKIYTTHDKLVKEITLPLQGIDNVDKMLWRMDGSGVFIGFYEGSYPYSISSYSLVLVSIPDGDAVLVDQSPWILPNFRWISNGN